MRIDFVARGEKLEMLRSPQSSRTAKQPHYIWIAYGEAVFYDHRAKCTNVISSRFVHAVRNWNATILMPLPMSCLHFYSISREMIRFYELWRKFSHSIYFCGWWRNFFAIFNHFCWNLWPVRVINGNFRRILLSKVEGEEI